MRPVVESGERQNKHIKDVKEQAFILFMIHYLKRCRLSVKYPHKLQTIT